MDNELQGAIEVLTKRAEQKAQELLEIKRLVNSLCREAGQEPLYSDGDLGAGSASGTGSIRNDQFYGKSPITAAREYLEIRGRAVPLDEILQGLTQGGFDFNSLGWSESLWLRNLGISLSKNTAIFHRLPNNTIGLLKWYPEAKKKKSPKTQAPNGSSGNGGTEAADKPEKEAGAANDA